MCSIKCLFKNKWWEEENKLILWVFLMLLFTSPVSLQAPLTLTFLSHFQTSWIPQRGSGHLRHCNNWSWKNKHSTVSVDSASTEIIPLAWYFFYKSYFYSLFSRWKVSNLRFTLISWSSPGRQYPLSGWSLVAFGLPIPPEGVCVFSHRPQRLTRPLYSQWMCHAQNNDTDSDLTKQSQPALQKTLWGPCWCHW